MKIFLKQAEKLRRSFLITIAREDCL